MSDAEPATRSGGTEIHPTAIVDLDAELGAGVRVGPYAVIAQRVRIGEGTWVGPHVVIEPNTEIGRDCRISAHAVLGGPPQDRHYTGEPTILRIGDRVVLREYVSLSRATGDGAETVVGDDTEILAYSHAGHNCRIGRHVLITNGCQIAGHVVIEDRAVLGGMVGVIQFTHIGTMAMVGGLSRVVQDVLPYMLVNGNPLRTVAINRIGLQRANVSRTAQDALRRAHRLLVRSGLDVSRAVARIEADLEPCPEISHLLEFIRASRARGASFSR
ncbi:MAG TPA: acyl-ACP--UDP-N-acetylglucosamine O-acyltransferase [bacterium]|nr:acyl-ACP--UDP-N-acetylglucosamine O-acyltransferase [bacterium]